jgi:hypothetical protein
MDLNFLLTSLASKRPLFHSEADFQHVLAWEIHERYPDAKIRLEYRPAFGSTKMYVDIWVVLGNGTVIAIELKYKTRRLTHRLGDEPYLLLNQSAQDIGRYDFLKDVARLEQLAARNIITRGVAILLTNDSSYWRLPRTASTVDAAFRLHDGRLLAGLLSWGPKASEGTMRFREMPINLTAEYTARWMDYSALDSSKNGLFRHLLISIDPNLGNRAIHPV